MKLYTLCVIILNSFFTLVYAQDESNDRIYKNKKIYNWIDQNDRKNALQIPFNPYLENSNQLNKIDVIRRIKKFTSTLFGDYLKKKYRWYRSSSSSPSKRSEQASLPKNFTNDHRTFMPFIDDIKYKIRSRNMELRIYSPYLDFNGTLHYRGEGEIKLTRTIDTFGIQAEYKYFIRDSLQKLTIKKYFSHNFWIQTSIIKDNIPQDTGDKSAQTVEFFYSQKL